jgi:hypothetical protein
MAAYRRYSKPMRQEIEKFDDGGQTVRSYDADDRLQCIETINPAGQLKVAIDYLYDDAGTNVERIVRDAAGTVLRRMRFDAQGQEIAGADAGPVRWASMDGEESGLDPKGQEKIGD